MHSAADHLMRAVLIGIGATAFMDVVAAVRKSLFGVPSADYALVGRWLGHLLRGQIRHDAIGKSPPVRAERWIGWVAHYLIGIAFASLLVAMWGPVWACQPTLGPALIVGIGSVLAPFLIMQPGMGLGVAATRAPDPAAARVRSLVAHMIFGIGLYLAGLAATVMKMFECGALLART